MNIPLHPKRSKERRFAEHVTLAVSVVLLVGLVAIIVGLEVTRGSSPPRVVVTPDFAGAEQEEGAWYLPVEIKNTGDEAAESLRVDLVRPIEGDDPEIAELEYTFVAGGETVEGIAIFDEEPTADTIDIDVLSSTNP